MTGCMALYGSISTSMRRRSCDNFQNRNARFRYLFRRLRNTAYAVIDQVAEELRHSDFIPDGL